MTYLMPSLHSLNIPLLSAYGEGTEMNKTKSVFIWSVQDYGGDEQIN